MKQEELKKYFPNLCEEIENLQKKLDIAVKALEKIRTAFQFSDACCDGYEMNAISEQALKEMEEV